MVDDDTMIVGWLLRNKKFLVIGSLLIFAVILAMVGVFYQTFMYMFKSLLKIYDFFVATLDKFAEVFNNAVDWVENFFRDIWDSIFGIKILK